MASCLLVLFNCAVVFVFIESVVCPKVHPVQEFNPNTNNDPPFSNSFIHWITGNKIRHVTVTVGDETRADGLLISICRRGRWYWDFYASENWDRQTDRGLDGALPSYWFEIYVISGIWHRNGATVTFGAFTVTFANENDAVNFTGEAVDQ